MRKITKSAIKLYYNALECLKMLFVINAVFLVNTNFMNLTGVLISRLSITNRLISLQR